MTITQEIYGDVEAVDEEHAIELALKNTGYRRCDVEDINAYEK